MTALTPANGASYNWRRAVGAAGLTLLLGLLGYLVTANWSLLFPKPVLTAAAPADCDLHAGTCGVAFAGNRSIHLAIEPRQPTPNRPLHLRVATGGMLAQRADVTFSGVDMNMGQTRHALVDGGGGTFVGETSLPVCTRRHMRWRAVIAVEDADRVYRAVYEFDVNRR